MTVVRTGCSSWTSPAWNGRFYPAGLADGERLAFYARYFDCVEVDSTYYAPPNPHAVRGWARKTPEGFSFTLKLFRELLDPKQGLQPEKLRAFVATAGGLGEKLAAILLQFPPGFRAPSSGSGGNLDYLTALLDLLPAGPRYAVELRDASWFSSPSAGVLRALLRAHRIPLCWSYLTYLQVPPWRTADWGYVRFIGDHTTVPAEVHGSLRIDRTRETEEWARVLGASELESAFAFFNNHFAGYAPESVNLFRASLGLPTLRFRTESQLRLDA